MNALISSTASFVRLLALSFSEILLALPIMLIAKSCLLLLVAFAVSTALRRASASTRHMVWAAAFLGLLFLPLGNLLLPAIPISVLPPETGIAPTELPQPLAEESTATSSPLTMALPRGEVPSSLRRTQEVSLRGTETKGAFGWLLGVYGVGVFGVLSFFAIGLLQASRLTQRASPFDPNSQSTGFLEKIPNPSGSTRLLSSSEIRVPMTWGLFRPAVVLPKEAANWPRKEQRQALIHELAHVERRDWLIQLASHIACALYWFNPLIWVAARRLALEAELAADDRVLLSGSDSVDYADQLLCLVRRVGPRGTPAVSVLPMARRSQVLLRVQALINPRLRRSPMKTPRKWSLILGLAAATLTLSSAQLAPAAATQTPLIRASSNGDAALVQKLLNEGAEVDQKSPGQGTPLIAAASAGSLEVVELLLAAGAEPNDAETASPRPSDLQRTALTAAARSGNLEVVRTLLAAGSTVDRAPRGDATALIEALRSGHPEIARLLVENGADVNLTVLGDGSPLIAAAQQGDLESVRFLLDSGADPNAQVEGDGSPLSQAIGNGSRAVVQALIEAGADVNAEVPGDGNALLLASERGDVDLLEDILAAGGDLDLGIDGDGTALITAAQAGQLPALRSLIEAGADVNQVFPGDENALIQAAGNGHLKAVMYLVEQGADVNARVIANGNQLRTPLNQATRGGHTDVANFLRSAGAVE